MAFPFIIMTFAVDKVDRNGLSNTVHHAHLAKKTRLKSH